MKKFIKRFQISKELNSVVGLGVLPMLFILVNKVENSPDTYGAFQGFKMLGSGLCCGLSALVSGYAIGIVGDAGVRANAQNEEVFVGVILVLIFAEALGLYGLIVAIILSQGD